MSMYNMLNGVNPATFIILPILGLGHPDNYPRFRDCFVNEALTEIHVYTRTGGGNRGQGYGEEKLLDHPNYIRDFDDNFDNTYATYVFSVPEKFEADFKLVLENKFSETSDDYKNIVKDTFPLLKEQLDTLFAKEHT